MVGAIAGTPRLLRSRRGCSPVDEAVVEDGPELGLRTDEARERLAQAFVDSYADILVDALVRQERGADPVTAVREALAAAERSAET